MDHQDPPTQEIDTPRDDRARPSSRVSWRGAVVASLVAASLVRPLACLLARHDWRADLLTHFPEPALVVALVASLAVARKRPRLAIGLAVLAAWQAAPLLGPGRSNPVASDRGSPGHLRVMMANVLHDNRHYELLARLIRRERPDVVGLVECTPEWIERLADVRREFPYRVEAPDGPMGLALWFRAPARTMGPPRPPIPGGWLSLRASFDFGGRERHIWLVHPSPPQVRRNLPELAGLADRVAEAGGSRIVIGDLNATDGSPHFGDFLATSGLRDSRVGFGRQPSWPSWSPYRIAIDHAFVSDDLAVVGRRLGPTIGSDHFPLILDLAPAAGGSGRSAATSSR